VKKANIPKNQQKEIFQEAKEISTGEAEM